MSLWNWGVATRRRDKECTKSVFCVNVLGVGETKEGAISPATSRLGTNAIRPHRAAPKGAGRMCRFNVWSTSIMVPGKSVYGGGAYLQEHRYS